MGYRQGLYNIVCLYSGVLHNDSIYVYIVKLAPQPCPTLCHPMDCSLPGSSVHGILQARKREWVAVLFSRGLPNSGIEPRSPALQADSLPTEP